MADDVRHIVYLSYDGLTDPLGQSQILPYIKGLSKKGYRFTVVSFEKAEAFLKNRAEIEKLCIEFSIRWKPLTYHKKPPVVSTVYDVFVLWNQVVKVYNDGPIDIIHCRSYITALVGLRAKQKWGVKFIFDMRGFWADERVEGGLWNLNNPLFRQVYSYFKEREKKFIVNADHVVSLTHNAKKEIESWRLRNAPITVIPTCVDLDLFDPGKIKKEEQQELRISLGISETDFVLLYLGSWGTWYLTDEMLKFFATVKQSRDNAKFLIVSSDTINIDSFEHKADVIVTQVPRNQVPLYISIASASVFFIKPTFSKKASSATKMGEIMAMNVPIITNKNWGDVDMLETKELIVDLEDKNQLEINEWINSRKLTRHGKPRIDEFLTLQYGVHQYEMIYKNFVK